MFRYFLLIMSLAAGAVVAAVEVPEADSQDSASDSSQKQQQPNVAREVINAPPFKLQLPKGWQALRNQNGERIQGNTLHLLGFHRERVRIDFRFIGTSEDAALRQRLADRAKQETLDAMEAKAQHSDLDPKASQLSVSLEAGGEFHQLKSYNHAGDLYYFQYGLIGPHAVILVSVEGAKAMEDRVKPFETELAKLRWVNPQQPQ